MKRQSNENIAPQVLRGVCKELTKLVATPSEGIKVHLNEDDLTDIQATIMGPGKFAVTVPASAAPLPSRFVY